MKILYPLETKKRELDGALLLTSKLLKKGHDVYIGPKRELDFLIDKIKPNLYIGTVAAKDDKTPILFKHLKRNNCKIVIIDTEGGVIIDDIYKKRHHQEILQYCDRVFSWGKKGKSLIQEGTKYPKNRIIVAGAPWFDLLTNIEYLEKLYNHEIRQIKDQYGVDFILYNSRFSGSNLFNKTLQNDIDQNYADNEYYRYSDKLFNILNKTINDVAIAFPSRKLIIRPHPSENSSFYIEKFKDYPNIFVDERFNVRPWLMLSKLIFHNGCTTAIEASLMNKPTYAIMPSEKNEFDIDLPNIASIQVKSSEEFISAINDNYKDNTLHKLNSSQLSYVNEYIANISQNATDIISSEINKLNHKNFENINSLSYNFIKFKNYIYNNHSDIIRLIDKNKFNTIQAFKNYGSHKFNSLSQEEVLKYLEIFLKNEGNIAINQLNGADNSYKASLITK